MQTCMFCKRTRADALMSGTIDGKLACCLCAKRVEAMLIRAPIDIDPVAPRWDVCPECGGEDFTHASATCLVARLAEMDERRHL